MLTESGMLWAVANLATSVIARVAIGGTEMGRPQAQVEAAQRVCNRIALMSAA